MTKLEKLYSIMDNSHEVGVKLSKEVLQQVEGGLYVLIHSSTYVKKKQLDKIAATPGIEL